jgi:hypothetical protein
MLTLTKQAAALLKIARAEEVAGIAAGGKRETDSTLNYYVIRQ